MNVRLLLRSICSRLKTKEREETESQEKERVQATEGDDKNTTYITYKTMRNMFIRNIAALVVMVSVFTNIQQRQNVKPQRQTDEQ